MNNYDKQANDFLEKTNTSIEVEFLKVGDHFNDGVMRDIYSVTIKRGQRSYWFEFGQSVNDSGFYAMQGKRRTDLDRSLIDKPDALRKIIILLPMQMIANDKIHYPKAPTEYSILACLTKHPVTTFEDFCSEYGYDEDSRKVKKIYKAVKDEWLNVCAIWSGEEIELLQEIN